MPNPVKDDSRRSYGIVIRKTWRSTKFRVQPIFERLLLTYLWSCPAGENSSSIFYLALPTIADDLGTDTETVTRTVRQMVSDGWFEYDFEARVFFFPRQIEFDSPDNPNILKAFIKRSLELPDTPLLLKYYQQLKPFLERFAEGFPKPLTEQVLNRLANGIPNPVPSPTPIPSPNSNYAASPPYFEKSKTWRSEDPEFYDECVSELSEAIEGWYQGQKSPKQRGHMAGQVVNRLNRVIRVHPKALTWIVENKMRVPARANDWFAFVKTADKTMHKGGYFPDGNPCPPLCHEWASEARHACPLVPRLELKQ